MPGPARSRQQSWRLGGPGLACLLHLGSAAPPLRPHGSTLSGLLLGHLPLTAGSLRLGGVLRKHEHTGSGRKPPSMELGPAGAGAGASLPRCWQLWCLG